MNRKADAAGSAFHDSGVMTATPNRWGRRRTEPAGAARDSNRPLKVLITTDWWEPVVNGVVASVTTLRRELLALGCDVRVLTLAPGLRADYADGVYRIGSVSAGIVYDSARVGMPAHRKLLHEILRWRPDVVHSQCEFSTYVWARRIAKTLDIPLVHTYHTIYEDYTHYYSPSATVGKKVSASFSRHVLDRTDAVIVPTSKVKKLLQGYRVRKPIHVVPTGLDLSRFRPASSPEELADAQQLRASAGVEEHQRMLLSVCRLAKEKNLDEILDHLAEIDDPDTVLVIVGDGPYRPELEARVDKLGIRSRVRFIGCVDPAEVQRWYRAGDVFVSASLSETQGLTFIEALACGLPLLCRKDPSIASVVIDGETGYQFDSSEQFAQGLERILCSREERDRLAQAAVAHAIESCGSAQFAASVLAIYEQVRDPRVLRLPRFSRVAA